MGKKAKAKKPKKTGAAKEVPRESLLDDEGAPTRKFKQVLVELFGRYDKDGDHLLNHTELKAFSAAANEGGREFTAEELAEIQEFFDWKEDGQNGGGLTLRGWIDMYQTQTASREEDTWEDLKRLGYDDELEYQFGIKKTKCPELQTRLEELLELGRSGNLQGFVEAFVTPDVDEDDRKHFLERLQGKDSEPGESDTLLREIECCATGKGVFKIEQEKAEGPVVFSFHSPEKGMENVDREVAFVKVDGQWHAEG